MLALIEQHVDVTTSKSAHRSLSPVDGAIVIALRAREG